MSNIRDRIRRQLEIEDESRALGQRRYNARNLPWKPEAGAVEEEANLPPGKQLLKLCVGPVTEGIKHFIDESCNGKAGRRHSALPFVLLAEPDALAYLTCRSLINSAATECNHTTAAIKLGGAVVEHLEFVAFHEQNKAGYRGYLKKQAAQGYSRQRRDAVRKLFENEGVRIAASQAELLNLGDKLIDIAIHGTGLFAREGVKRAKGLVYKLRVTEDLQKWLDEQHARCSLLEPMHLPMLVRPRRWRSPTYGGYLTPRPNNRLIKQRNRAYHEEVQNADLSRVYDAVNHVQDTPWAINNDVLDVLQAVWDEGGSLGGLPARHDDPLPAKPHDIEENEDARKEWKRMAAETYTRNANLLSQRLALHQGIWVARKFADEPEIFYPHELDFRGRVYPIPSMGPNPQGSDWQKGLLHFAHGKPLGKDGLHWLFVHVANLFGVDKVEFDDRVQWVHDNAAAILDSGANPLDGERFWTTADSPYCALAACIELNAAMSLENPSEYVSRIPVALDGSCSGLQHFSAMLRDREGGRAVNLLPSKTPQDVYMAVAGNAQAEADATPTITYTDGYTKEEVTIPNPWMNGMISRKLAKRPTMTFCYSATRFGMMEMILQTLREIDRENEAKGEGPYLGGADNYHSATWLSHVLHRAISTTVSAAARAMDWLRDAAKVAATEGLPLWWTTPLGLPILQEYKKMTGKRVNVHWSGARVQLMVQEEGDKLDSRSQANGVAPNFVHSLDAAHLQAVALAAKAVGIRHLAVIHDSFGTHASDTGTLSRLLRETFVEQYSGDVLGDFYEELKAQLGDELAEKLPKPPEAGDLDLNEILLAQYTFA